MSYVQHVLRPGEEIMHSTQLHWIIYLPGLVVLIPAVIIYAVSFAPDIDNNVRFTVSVTGTALLAIAVVLLFVAWFRRWTTEFAITSRRIIYKRGFIWRRTIEMQMDKVESVDVHQSILGRILNFGTITVRGVGVGIEPLPKIAAPIEFRHHVTAS